MGGGIVTFIASIAVRQVNTGAAVAVLYAERPDTPPREDLRERFGDQVVLRAAISESGALRRLSELAREVRRSIRSGSYDVIHLHSSIAGAVGRIVAGAARRSGVVIAYSPHGFAFLREDSSRVMRLSTRLVERVLANRGTMILTSKSELALAKEALHARRATYLMSGVPRESMKMRLPGQSRGQKPRVVMLGRMAYQKAPWRFAAVARRLAHEADFIWIGAADPVHVARWIGDAPVQVISWLTPERFSQELENTDVLLFPTLWEGMSLSLIQAMGRGIPPVTTDVVGNRDAVIHQVSGFIARNDDELVDFTQSLVRDQGLRERVGAQAFLRAATHFIDDQIGIESIELYSI